MTVYFSDLTDYNQGIDLEIIFTKYRIYFEGKYSAPELIFAIHEHSLIAKEFPRVPDLLKILNPEKPKITEAQFVEAQKWQERNGFPMFSDAKTTIERYKAQENQKQQDYEIKSEKIKSLVSDVVKKISKS